MWHSLAGLARERAETLDFERCHPAWIADGWQPRVVGLKIRARGTGALKLELKSATESSLWEHRFILTGDKWTEFSAGLEPAGFHSVKFLNWVAEGGTWARVDGVWLEVELPPVDFDQNVFAVSYAKLSRCYSRETGLVRDRAHFAAGTFDSIPASGMFCLASAVAARLGVVPDDFARDVLHRTHAVVEPMTSPLGLLPHFSHHDTAGFAICPETEFSTVDTAIYLHSMRLAARVLRDEASEEAVERAVQRIDFAALRDADGFIGHGTLEDGVTRLPHAWRDWGGESALVLLLARLAEGEESVLRMHDDGRVFRGVGFIAELQSLFFPQFNSDRPDALTGVNWRLARTNLFAAQKSYVTAHFPESPAARLGAYGLSAGEGRSGIGYAVSGIEATGQTLIHPHYMLMAASLETDTGDVYQRLWRMEDAGWFTPWGLVENIALDTNDYLPMNGSLNAAFESIGAYHAMAKNRGAQDAIYDAANSSVALRDAVRLFATR
jgi:hypothetical protein